MKADKTIFDDKNEWKAHEQTAWQESDWVAYIKPMKKADRWQRVRRPLILRTAWSLDFQNIRIKGWLIQGVTVKWEPAQRETGRFERFHYVLLQMT